MATRLYFHSTTVPGVSPDFTADWEDISSALRRVLLSDKEVGDALANANSAGAGMALIRQFVSSPIDAQTIDGTVKLYAMAREPSAIGDVTGRLTIKVVSGDGSTVRGTLLAFGDHSPGSFFHSSLRNKVFADGDALSAVVAQAGDRLVVEIGASNPSEGTIGFSFGAPSGTSDLPENETETGSLVPWIEFSDDIAFQPLASGVPGGMTLLGVGNGA